VKVRKNNKKGVEILIAEDSATQREQLRGLLEKRGFAVTAVSDGKQALQAIGRRAPTLVISDIVMPELDGYGLCRAIKSDEALKHIPVMLVTTLSDPLDVVAGLECGADNFIRKPYDERYLISRIEYLRMNLELREHQKVHMGVEISLGGKRHFITAERQQILDLLISIYEQAVRINDDLKSREQELLHSNDVLNGLYRIAEGLNGAVSQRAVAEMALERALEVPGVQAGWISLREGESGFRLLAARGLPPALESPGAMEGECACRRKLLSGELDSVTNILECERLAKAQGDTRGLRVHASVPLWLGGQMLGVMNLAGPNEGLFAESELKMLYGIGHEVAVALERARLHEHLERLVEERTAKLTAEIAERKQIEEAQARLVAILEATTDMVGISDMQGRPVYLNAGGRRMFGIGPDESLPETAISDYHLPAERERILTEAIPAAIRDGIWKGESAFLARDGREIPVSQVVIAHKDADGNLCYLSTIARDVTEQRRAEEQLREAEFRYRSVFENVVEGIFLVNPDGRVVSGNPALARMLGYASFDDMMASVRKVAQDIYVEPGSRGRFRRTLGANGVVEKFETRWRRKDGRIIWVSLSARMMTGLMGGKIHHVGVAEDITERKQAEEKIGRLNRVYAVLSGVNTAIVRIRDREELFDEACRIAVEHGKFVFAWIGLLDADTRKVNPVAKAGRDEGYLGRINLSADEGAPGSCELTARALTGAAPVVCNDIQSDERMKTWRAEALERGYRAIALLPLVVEDRPIGIFVLYAPEPGVFDEAEMKLLVEMAGDISFALDHIGKAERLDYLAYYDDLTGLPNRTLFYDRANQLLRAAQKQGGGHKVAIVLLDLERFRTINETLGRHVGDAVLKQVAERLAAGRLGPDHLARIGADTFAAVLGDLDKEEEAAHFVEGRAIGVLHEPIVADGQELRISVKAGIALFPADGADVDTLFHNAEAALKKAKLSGDRYLFYTPELNARAAERLTLENKLRRALECRELALHYQPVVDLRKGNISGLEALMRWNDPDLGPVPPARFIPVMEETGLILEAGRWALDQAVADFRRWQANGLHPPRIAVNVSQIQLRRTDFVATVERALSGAGGAAGVLELEITESLIMQDVEANIHKLKAVRNMGVEVAIDDFGTGFSSLSYIAKLPINVLKIDRAFIMNLTRNPGDVGIVTTIISLAHSLDLKVVAEGVETVEQANLLRLLKCDEMQGYLFSPAVPAERIEQFLRENKTLPVRSAFPSDVRRPE